MSFIKLKQVNLCYEMTGDQGSPSIILIMGFGGQLIQWPSELINSLSQLGYRVITFDNRDAGLTTFLSSQSPINLQEIFKEVAEGNRPSLPYSLIDMAEDVIQLMDAFRIKKAHILGMSVGGMIVQLLAIHHPERLESQVCISSSSGDPQLQLPTHTVQEKLMDFTQTPSVDERDQVERRLELFKVYNPSFTDKDLEQTAELAHEEYGRRTEGNSLTRQILAVTTAPSRVENLKNLTLKTLILHGKEDPVFPLSHGKQLHTLIKGSQFYEIDHMGHGFIQQILSPLCTALIQFYS